MNKQTYYLIADIIQRYRTWIIVKDTEQLVEMRILHDGVLKPLFPDFVIAYPKNLH